MNTCFFKEKNMQKQRRRSGWFKYIDSTIPKYFLKPKFQASSPLLWLHLFMSHMVGNPADSFSNNAAQITPMHIMDIKLCLLQHNKFL